jgi:flagellin
MAVFSVQSNVASMRAQRHVGANQTTLNKTLQRLSSGFRINGAQDDAAGLGVSERLRAQVRGMAVASKNAADGFNIVQAAEGAMGEVADILQRLREIAVQSATDGITATEQGYLDKEFQGLLGEVDRLSDATKYNGQKLMTGTFTGKKIQVGADSGADFQITVSIAKVDTSSLSLSVATVSTLAKANTAIGNLDTAINFLNNARAKLGALMSNLQTAGNHVDVMRENLAASESRIRDTDIAQETSQFARSQVLMQAGVSMLAQANAQPQIALRLLG